MSKFIRLTCSSCGTVFSTQTSEYERLSRAGYNLFVCGICSTKKGKKLVEERLTGQLDVVDGHDKVEIELPKLQQLKRVNVSFKDSEHIHCGHHHVHHEDELDWSVHKHDAHKFLVISWKIYNGPRVIGWEVVFE